MDTTLEDIDIKAKKIFNENEIEKMKLRAQQSALSLVFEEQCKKLEDAGEVISEQKKKCFEAMLNKMID